MSKGKPNKAVFRKLCHSKEALTAEEKQETRTKRKKITGSLPNKRQRLSAWKKF